jgi:hypothetical protein
MVTQGIGPGKAGVGGRRLQRNQHAEQVRYPKSLPLM